MNGRAPAPPAHHVGTDPTDTVRVRIDGTATDAQVTLEPGWRTELPPDRLGDAVRQAFTAATVARLAAWAEGPSPTAARPPTPRGAGGSRPPTREAVDALARAWRDVREFALRLTELNAAVRTAASPGALATATVRGGQLVALDVQPAWGRVADDDDLEHHLGHALRAALNLIATTPQQALDGCPDLVAALAGSTIPLPFPVPPPPAS